MSLLQHSASASASTPASASPAAERRQRRAHTHTHTQHTHTRKHTRSSSDTTSVDAAPGPWQQTAQAYAWVAHAHADVHEESSKRKRTRCPFKTEEWVREQQFLLDHKDEYQTEEYQTRTEDYYYGTTRARARPAPAENKYGRGEWEELVYVFGGEAEDWMRQEERARRLAQEREKARARIQEEVRRIEARFQQKREAGERRAREEERRRAADDKEKEKRDRAKLDRLIVDAWKSYERRWTALLSSSEDVDVPLEFRRTPWPLIVPPRDTGDITRDAIVAFLFAPVHSAGQTRRDRIRSAQLRWHPDRFRRFLGRVVEKDRASVEEGVGIVARCLNELMEKETKQK